MATQVESTADVPLWVAIDGPAGAGKSSVARRLAQILNLVLLDTGALYRTTALAASQRGVEWSDGSKVAALIPELGIQFVQAGHESSSDQRVILDGNDVTARIREPEISEGASIVSSHAAVRAALLSLQRELSRGGCVAEGRDIGTVVLPAAQHKFFLTASLEARSRRRHEELVQRGGERAPALPRVREDMDRRDSRDSQRSVAPLEPAADAQVIDSSRLDIDGVVDLMLARIRGPIRH